MRGQSAEESFDQFSPTSINSLSSGWERGAFTNAHKTCRLEHSFSTYLPHTTPPFTGLTLQQLQHKSSFHNQSSPSILQSDNMVRTRSTTARLNAASNNENGSGSANITSLPPAVTGAGAAAQDSQSSNSKQASVKGEKSSRSASITSSPPAVLDAAEKDSQSSGSQKPQSREQTPDEGEEGNGLAKITSSPPVSNDGPTAAASEGESENDESENDEDEEDEDEEDEAPIPDDAFDAVAKDEPSASKKKLEDDDEVGESELPLSGDSIGKAAEYQPYVPKESDDDQVPVPASLFERFQRAANRPHRKGAGPSSSSLLESEYDSEDIIVAPRKLQGNSKDVEDAPQPRSSKAGGASSDLSELGSTPEPVDPELVRLAGEEKRRKLELCQCEGWCTCERYNIFYGAAEGSSDLPSQSHLSERVLADEELPESSMRSTVNSGKRSIAFDDERAGKKRRTEQVFSWDRAGKPKRAPAGWEGEW